MCKDSFSAWIASHLIPYLYIKANDHLDTFVCAHDDEHTPLLYSVLKLYIDKCPTI